MHDESESDDGELTLIEMPAWCGRMKVLTETFHTGIYSVWLYYFGATLPYVLAERGRIRLCERVNISSSRREFCLISKPTRNSNSVTNSHTKLANNFVRMVQNWMGGRPKINSAMASGLFWATPAASLQPQESRYMRMRKISTVCFVLGHQSGSPEQYMQHKYKRTNSIRSTVEYCILKIQTKWEIRIFDVGIGFCGIYSWDAYINLLSNWIANTYARPDGEFEEMLIIRIVTWYGEPEVMIG